MKCSIQVVKMMLTSFLTQVYRRTNVCIVQKCTLLKFITFIFLFMQHRISVFESQIVFLFLFSSFRTMGGFIFNEMRKLHFYMLGQHINTQVCLNFTLQIEMSAFASICLLMLFKYSARCTLKVSYILRLPYSICSHSIVLHATVQCTVLSEE